MYYRSPYVTSSYLSSPHDMSRTILPILVTSPYVISLKEPGWPLHPFPDLTFWNVSSPYVRGVFSNLHKNHKKYFGEPKNLVCVISPTSQNYNNPWANWTFALTWPTVTLDILRHIEQNFTNTRAGGIQFRWYKNIQDTARSEQKPNSYIGW
jgi:hypothetical protein